MAKKKLRLKKSVKQAMIRSFLSVLMIGAIVFMCIQINNQIQEAVTLSAEFNEQTSELSELEQQLAYLKDQRDALTGADSDDTTTTTNDGYVITKDSEGVYTLPSLEK